MDGFDLFRKLAVGTKLDFKRFKKDAEHLKLRLPEGSGHINVKSALDFFGTKTQPKKDLSDSEDEIVHDVSKSPKAQSNNTTMPTDSDSQSEPEELQLLGNIKSTGDDAGAGLNKKRKKTKRKSAAALEEMKTEKINRIRNKKRIHVHGSDIAGPVKFFNELKTEYGVQSRILQNLQAVGYNHPTPIQMQIIPIMLQRREVMACAPTGSGKTAAFIIPILHQLKQPMNKGFRALVLSPSRELAKQTYQWFHRLSDGCGFRIHYIEKASTAAEKFGPKSSMKFDVLITTPNRLLYLLQQDPPVISLSNVEWLVVDECDKLFEEGKRGFREQLAEIYKACDNSCVRRALFSATFAYEVEQWCKINLDNVIQVYIGAKNRATRLVKQSLLFVSNEAGKLFAMRDMIKKGIEPPILIFVQSKDRAKELFSELIYEGINVDIIHADRTQTQRDNVVASFRSGRIWVLICTELMGRGIDFQGVSLVINYDFPNSAISYIHRIGRTGRAGHHGKAITFFTDDDAVNLRSIANVMKAAGCPVPDYMLRLEKPDRKIKRKLSKTVPERQKISTVPKFDLQKIKRKKAKLRRKQSKVNKDTNGSGGGGGQQQNKIAKGRKGRKFTDILKAERGEKVKSRSQSKKRRLQHSSEVNGKKSAE